MQKYLDAMSVLCKILGHKIFCENGVGGENRCVRCGYVSPAVEWPDPPRFDDERKNGCILIDGIPVCSGMLPTGDPNYSRMKAIKSCKYYSHVSIAWQCEHYQWTPQHPQSCMSRMANGEVLEGGGDE